MKDKELQYELQVEVGELRTQVALLTRYIKVLQDKVKDLETWHNNEKYKGTEKIRGLSDFGTTTIGEKSTLGSSIKDVTKYPWRGQPESD